MYIGIILARHLPPTHAFHSSEAEDVRFTSCVTETLVLGIRNLATFSAAVMSATTRREFVLHFAHAPLSTRPRLTSHHLDRLFLMADGPLSPLNSKSLQTGNKQLHQYDPATMGTSCH